MIDIEYKVFKIVYDAVMSIDDSIYVTSETSNAPPSFPAVYVEQIDSYDPPQFRISSREEIYAAMTFNVEVYSNKPSGNCLADMSALQTPVETSMHGGKSNGFLNCWDLFDGWHNC